MKLQELRISNLFYPINRKNKVHLPVKLPFKIITIGFEIEAIPFDKIPAQVEKWTVFNPNEMSPIPLTEKWLLDFGFNKDYKKGYIGKDFANTDFVLTEPLVMGEWQKGYAFQFHAGGWSRFKEIKYVHELQNFYFEMTKEELFINKEEK